ncbi:MAG: 3'(2'),5'-bisphosphate nucleotidase CysQ [Rhodobacteraceae bacterium]|nr:MAG: 3'(2'),5'-bisphosphate nucleotidase CysQ [Paracoccaceae bacterium]
MCRHPRPRCWWTALSSPAADLALLVEAAQAAGDAAMAFFGRAKQWDKPEGAGPVTEADLAADALLKRTLSAARPGYGWLSEETPDDAARLGHERIFIVDPIDGTRAFIAGTGGWCVAATVVEAGRPVAAAAWFPVERKLYQAAAGLGATRDGAPIRPSARETVGGAEVLAGAAQLEPRHWPGGAPPVRRGFRPSLVHRFCLVAEGRVDATLSFSDAWEWDVAAGALIAAEAGCVVTDGHGAPHRFNAPRPKTPGLVVAPPALHAALMALRLGAR